ncbi:MAG TPA: hypothetical protein VLV81_04755 [Acidimicrobiia bacterium]|nr:hypothetical protein [Acidimicrobiia bacterium]
MSRRLAARLALGYLAVTGLFVGAWAAIAPRSFFSDFPGLGHMWTAADGRYNEHLVRDVGDLNLALVVVTVAACIWFTRSMAVTAALAWIVYSVPHLVYHLFNLGAVTADDRPAEVVTLAVPVVLAAFIIAIAARDPAPRPD